MNIPNIPLKPIYILFLVVFYPIFLLDPSFFSKLGYIDYIHSTGPGISFVLYMLLLFNTIVYVIYEDRVTIDNFLDITMIVVIIIMGMIAIFYKFLLRRDASEKTKIKSFMNSIKPMTYVGNITLYFVMVLLSVYIAIPRGHVVFRRGIIVAALGVSIAHLIVGKNYYIFVKRRQSDG
jgi:hypothetical protein